jgi:GDPmannose 4,6-dehydratase
VLGLKRKLFLGNLDAQRDWGHAKDYVEAMWLILQQEQPEDFVIATGITTAVREFVKLAFGHAGVTIRFEGEGVNEKGIVEAVTAADAKVAVGEIIVEVDERYFRPTEVDLLLGNPAKAQQKLGWKAKYSVDELAKEMVDADLEHFRKELLLKDSGYRTLNQYE